MAPSGEPAEDRAGRAGLLADIVPGCDARNRAPLLRKPRAKAFTPAKRQLFLDALALTCNISRAAAWAGTTMGTIYRHREKDPVFAEQWRAAFTAGYDRLEALVLEHGGAGVAMLPADPARAEAEGAAPPFDFDRALKLLQFHRAARDGAGSRNGSRSGKRRRPTREETNAALLKAIAAAERRVAQREKGAREGGNA